MRKRAKTALMLAALCCSMMFWSGTTLALDPRRAVTQYVHDVWQVEDGLPQNAVTAIIQTRDGYLWLGTQEGLVRFDGVQFTVFDTGNTKELKNNTITALAEDRKGNLWIGTINGGLTRFKNGRFSTYTTREGLSHNGVRAIYEDRKGNLWIGTRGGGLNRLRNGTFTVYTTQQGLPSDIVTAIDEDRQGSLWIGTTGGLTRLKDGVMTPLNTKDGLASNRVVAIYEDRQGNLWFGALGGLTRLKNGVFTRYSTAEGLAHDFVTSICEDQDGSLWIGTEGGGLTRLKDGVMTTFSEKDGLSNDKVLSVYEDREGSLWIGTNGGGLNRLREAAFTTYSTKEGLSHDIVTTVYEDRDGNIWVGTERGLNRLRGGQVTIYTVQNGLAHNRVRSIAQDHEGNLWVGTRGGLTRIKDGTLTVYTTKQGLTNNLVMAIHEDRQGNLWIGTGGGGLNRLRDGVITALTIKDGLSSNVVLAIYEDQEGSLWVGTNRGLNRIKGGALTTYTTQDGLGSDIVVSLSGDRDGTLWIGTYGGGLSRFRHGGFTTYTTQHGLFNDVVYQILDDGRGNLWMSCNKGVFRVSKKDLNDFADGKITTIRSIAYGKADGLRSGGCNGTTQPAGWKTRDGKLWFPTDKGVVMIDPAHIESNELLPPVVIEQALIDKRPVDVGQTAKLPVGSGQLEFHYTGLSLLVPQRVRFRYKLEGFDKEWIEAGTRRVAYYTNIPPGEYRFRVRASNNDGVWNEAGASFAFHLQPPFYQTKLFYALIGVVLLLMGWSGYQLRVRRLVRRAQELEAKVKARTAEVVRQKEKLARSNEELQRLVEAKQQAAEALRQSEERFRALAESASDAIIGFDSQGKIFVWNKSAHRIFGYTAEQAIGQPFAFLLPEQFRATYQRELETAPSSGQLSVFGKAVELAGLRSDGREFPAEVSFSSWKRGGEVFYTSIIRDITERKRAEVAMQAAARLEATTTLAGGIAHQFNNLMVGVLGNAELLQMDVADQPSLMDRLATIAASAERAGELAQQLLAFARGGKYQPLVMNLNQTVLETLHSQAHSFPLRIRIEHELEPQLWNIKADPTQMAQMLMDLCTNAIEAIQEDGCITITTGNLNVQGRLTQAYPNLKPGRYVSLTVTDTGCGMDAAVQTRVFEPFFTTKFMGRGLGLAAVYGIVKNHGGQVFVSSRPARGTTFEIYLPAIDSDIEISSQQHSARTGSETILAIDDDETVLSITRELLRRLGYRVLTAGSGREALEVARAFDGPIDLALLDMGMPVMSGPEVYPLLKKIRPRMKVILCSGYDLDASAQALLDAGVSAFIRKPFSLDVLASEIRKALENEPSPCPTRAAAH